MVLVEVRCMAAIVMSVLLAVEFGGDAVAGGGGTDVMVGIVVERK